MGKWFWTGVLILWVLVMLISGMLLKPVWLVITCAIVIITAITWLMDRVVLDNPGERWARNGAERSRHKHPTPITPMSHSFDELQGTGNPDE